MEIDLEAVRVAVRASRKQDIFSHFVVETIDDRVLGDYLDPVLESYGADAVIAALAPHRADPDIAEALFYVFFDSALVGDERERDMLAVFSEDELVEAAVQELLACEDDRGAPHWGRSALWQHEYNDAGAFRLSTDERAFGVLVAVIDRVPMDEKILWMIADGPLRHASAHPRYRERLDALAQTDPKIARLLAVHDELVREWTEREEPTFTVDGKQYTADEFLHRFSISDFPIHKHLDRSTDP